MPSTRTIALTATSVLAIAAAGFIGATAGSNHADRDDTASAAAGSATSTGAASPGAAATTRAAASGTPTPRKAPSGSVSADPHVGAEILPTPAGPSATGGVVPLSTRMSAQPDPMFDGQLPEPAAAQGRLVAGFPAALTPPTGTSVDSSSVAVNSGVVQAALVASGGDPKSILTHYRAVLAAHGFAEQKAQGVENAPAAAFTRGRNNVTITTQDGKTYVLANLRPRDEA